LLNTPAQAIRKHVAAYLSDRVQFVRGSGCSFMCGVETNIIHKENNRIILTMRAGFSKELLPEIICVDLPLIFEKYKKEHLNLKHEKDFDAPICHHYYKQHFRSSSTENELSGCDKKCF
jgi:hypothetical protein